MSNVVIIGAGLAGSLLAIYLAKRGIAVDIFEARGDMRKEEIAAGRSINLALSNRGIAALRQVGMDEYMLAEAVPMYGRMIHSMSGETKLLPYSGRKGEYINSVSRAGLNTALINEAEKNDGVKFHFTERCVDLDCGTGEVAFESGHKQSADTLIGTDGAGSAVRQAMDQLEGFIMAWLQAMNANNIATDAGTAYLSTRSSATVSDGEAFLNHVKTHNLWDLMDKRANAPAVAAYVEQHQAAPPGINFRTMVTLGVRKR